MATKQQRELAYYQLFTAEPTGVESQWIEDGEFHQDWRRNILSRLVNVTMMIQELDRLRDAFTPAAIDQAARDQERYDAGWNAGYDAAEAKRMPLVEAYALVAADLEQAARVTQCDDELTSALLTVRERLTKMEEGK